LTVGLGVTVGNDMNEIYVLKRRPADYFGDGPAQWELAGWTDDRRVAGQWRNGATMHENRDIDRVKKVTPNVLADRPAAPFAAGPATEGSEVERRVGPRETGE
jgi:hypothetical protein